MTKIKIGGQEYTAVVSGLMKDNEWDGRESKSITLEIDYATAVILFVNDAVWSIITEDVIEDEVVREEYDNSDFCIAGDIIDHRNGIITAKMGKPTDLEDVLELLLG